MSEALQAELAALRARAERAETMLELTQKNMITAQEHATKAEKEVWAAMRTARAEALREADEAVERLRAAQKPDLREDSILLRACLAIRALAEKEKPDAS